MRTHLKLHRFMSLLVIGAMLFLSGAGALPPAADGAMTRVIVQGHTLEQAAAAVRLNGGQVAANIDIIRAVVADVPAGNVARLSRTAGVVRVTLDRVVKVAGFKPEDRVLFKYPQVVGADEVWDSHNYGQNVTVAFMDTGIDPTFIGLRLGPGSLQDRFLAYYDAIEDELYGPNRLLRSPRDPNGHGSHVAGIVGNSAYANGQFLGIAPATKLVAVRVLDENGMGTYADVLRGLNWVVQNKARYNIRVLNMSMYATPVAPYWADPYNLAVMAAWQAGIVVVASAGNGGPAPLSIGVPGNTPYIITVGAFTDNYTPDDFGDDYMPPFSATGPTLDAFVKPDVIAPGAHMASTMRPNTELADEYPENRIIGNYFKMSGTSMSAAVVSGIVALMLKAHPELTPDQVKYRLAMTARPQFSEQTGEMAYSIWQQGAGRVWAPDAVSTNIQGVANLGMDLDEDLAGNMHYEGATTYNPETGEFVVRDDGFTSWSGGYVSWSGGYTSWSGGYTSWSGGDTNWSGGYTSWSGGYTSWSGGYTSWSGGYTSWSGNVGNPEFAAAFATLQNLPSSTSSVGINHWVDENE